MMLHFVGSFVHVLLCYLYSVLHILVFNMLSISHDARVVYNTTGPTSKAGTATTTGAHELILGF